MVSIVSMFYWHCTYQSQYVLPTESLWLAYLNGISQQRYIHPHTHTHTQTHTHTHTVTHRDPHTHTRTRTRTLTLTQTHSHTLSHMDTDRLWTRWRKWTITSVVNGCWNVMLLSVFVFTCAIWTMCEYLYNSVLFNDPHTICIIELTTLEHPCLLHYGLMYVFMASVVFCE